MSRSSSSSSLCGLWTRHYACPAHSQHLRLSRTRCLSTRAQQVSVPLVVVVVVTLWPVVSPLCLRTLTGPPSLSTSVSLARARCSADESAVREFPARRRRHSVASELATRPAPRTLTAPPSLSTSVSLARARCSADESAVRECPARRRRHSVASDSPLCLPCAHSQHLRLSRTRCSVDESAASECPARRRRRHLWPRLATMPALRTLTATPSLSTSVSPHAHVALPTRAQS